MLFRRNNTVLTCPHLCSCQLKTNSVLILAAAFLTVMWMLSRMALFAAFLQLIFNCTLQDEEVFDFSCCGWMYIPTVCNVVSFVSRAILSDSDKTGYFVSDPWQPYTRQFPMGGMCLGGGFQTSRPSFWSLSDQRVDCSHNCLPRTLKGY